MKRKAVNSSSVIPALIVSSLFSAVCEAVDLTATWDGGGDGVSYSDPNNWDIDVVPVNSDPVIFDVIIPASTVNFDFAGSSEVRSLNLGSNSQLRPLTGAALTIQDTAEIFGVINAIGGNFTAVGAGASLAGDRARVFASDGSDVTIGATSYSSKALWATDNFTSVVTYNWSLMTASGAETLLDLSSLQSIDAGYSSFGNDINIHWITASDGATIDLSGVQTVTAPASSSNRLEFNLSTGGSIDLASLQTATSAGKGITRFNVDAATLSLPALETASEVAFVATGGGTISANGPSPVTYSSKALWATDNFTSVVTYNWNLMTASGPGSLLDLSSLQSIDTGYSSFGNDINIHWITASDGATIDLSGVQTVTAPASSSNNWLSFNVSNGSVVNLSSLQTLASAGSGRLSFNVTGGSEVLTGGLDIKAPNTLFTTDGGSTLKVGGDLKATAGSASVNLAGNADTMAVAGTFDLDSNITMTAADGATLMVGNDLTYTHTDETAMQLAGTVLTLNGIDVIQFLEVGGLDVDVATSLLSNDNFGFGQLIVGDDSLSSIVQLLDLIDNGNRGTGDASEALYLFGLNGEDGLSILGGSTLYLNDLPTYALLGGEITDLFTLFPDGVTKIPFDEGFLATSAVPIPPAMYLFASAIFGFVGMTRKYAKPGKTT